ncbi:lysylphosphatidylglycerol synthase transmembrane domain-containing protein [Planococcus sp. APC 4015]|nr:lysylphosphatidylglycerol synthase transmembrane domain-containing protein [Planococcus sp. APC 4015]
MVLRVTQSVVALGLLVLVWRLAGPDAIGMLATANPGWLMLAGVLLLAHTVFAALRWRVTAAPLGIDLTRRQAITEYFLAQLVNTTLPGGVVGDAGRAARSRHHSGLGAAAGAVAMERTIGQLSLFVVLGAAFVITLVLPTGIVWPTGIAVTVASVLVAVSVAVLALAVAARRAQPRPGGRTARLLDGLRRTLVATDVLRAQVALSAATTACILGAFACCIAAVGGTISIVAVAAVVPLVLLAMLLPLSIGGWGVREGAAVALLPIAGVAAAEALAASVAFGIVASAVALPGLVAIWARRRAQGAEIVPGSEHVVLQHPFRNALPEESPSTTDERSHAAP